MSQSQLSSMSGQHPPSQEIRLYQLQEESASWLPHPEWNVVQTPEKNDGFDQERMGKKRSGLFVCFPLVPFVINHCDSYISRCIQACI